MVKSLITLVLSTLRWTHWLVQYAVVYPLGMMMLLVVVVFWTGHNTPGQMLVKTIESVQREGYVIHDCTGPASREALNGDAVKPLLSPVYRKPARLSVRMRQGTQHISTRVTQKIFSGSGC